MEPDARKAALRLAARIVIAVVAGAIWTQFVSLASSYFWLGWLNAPRMIRHSFLAMWPSFAAQLSTLSLWAPAWVGGVFAGWCIGRWIRTRAVITAASFALGVFAWKVLEYWMYDVMRATLSIPGYPVVAVLARVFLNHAVSAALIVMTAAWVTRRWRVIVHAFPVIEEH